MISINSNIVAINFCDSYDTGAVIDIRMKLHAHFNIIDAFKHGS